MPEHSVRAIKHQHAFAKDVQLMQIAILAARDDAKKEAGQAQLGSRVETPGTACTFAAS